jgi:hypothetical protein
LERSSYKATITAAITPGKWRGDSCSRVDYPVLIGDPDDGGFAEGTVFSRVRVQESREGLFGSPAAV